MIFPQTAEVMALVAHDNKEPEKDMKAGTGSEETRQASRLEEPITFNRGLPGLGESRRFTLHVIEDNPLFYYLQSIEEQDVGLILVDPFPCFPDYSLEISDQDKKELQLDQVEDVLVFTTVTLLGESKMTTNLAAPVVVNTRSRLAKQLILPERVEEMRVPLPVNEE